MCFSDGRAERPVEDCADDDTRVRYEVVGDEAAAGREGRVILEVPLNGDTDGDRAWLDFNRNLARTLERKDAPGNSTHGAEAGHRCRPCAIHPAQVAVGGAERVDQGRARLPPLQCARTDPGTGPVEPGVSGVLSIRSNARLPSRRWPRSATSVPGGQIHVHGAGCHLYPVVGRGTLRPGGGESRDDTCGDRGIPRSDIR